MTPTFLLWPGVSVIAALVLGACATVQPARMALPDGLAERSERVELPALTTSRRGQTEVLGRKVQFERSASRLDLFNEFVLTERAALRYALDDGSPDASAANCAVKRRTVSVGVIEWTAKPLTLFCDFTPTGARLALDEHRPGLGTMKVDRRGRLTVGGRNFTVRSLHRAEGGLFELAHPIGYVIEDLGRPMAAVETHGHTPRLFLPTNDPALRQASLHALLALALMWDVGNG